MVKQQCRKLPNWKAPGPDGVQGYWIKKLPALHNRIAKQFDDLINGRANIPEWMTRGKTVVSERCNKR